jgi:HlyD family secretion protein
MKRVLIFASIVFFAACKSNNTAYDAQGTFEADEVIVSSEIGGKLLDFTVKEGDTIAAGKIIAHIDALNIALQKEQAEASIAALGEKTVDVVPQVKLLQDQLLVQDAQLKNLQHEQTRIENLLKQDAATGKQLDDINYQIDVLQRQMKVTQQQIVVQQSNVRTQNRSILSETNPLQKKAAQLQDQMQRAAVINPITGTVLTTYALQGEVTGAGKALYKIADVSTVYLRAYVNGTQLAQIKIGQPVKVLIDSSNNDYRTYNGSISWVSSKAEFTPKTIQTKEERANLVYAIKVKVVNDGLLKIGMFGEVKF